MYHLIFVLLLAASLADAKTLRVKCHDGTYVTSLRRPVCDIGPAFDGACIFQFQCSPCHGCVCPLTPCDVNKPFDVSLNVGERLVIPGCRVRRVPRLVLRCRS